MSDFAALFRFVNHSYPQQPWRQLFLVATLDDSLIVEGLGRFATDSELREWYRIEGEPFCNAAAQALQDYVRRVLTGLMADRIQFSTGRLPLTFHYHPKDGLRTNIDHRDLKLFFDWLMIELIRQGRHQSLSTCAECGRFWLRRRKTGKYCTDPCRKRANDRVRR
jgi:hypothetical protein